MDCIGTIAVIFTLFVNYVTANEEKNRYGTISIIQPAFVHRNLTIKMTPSIVKKTTAKWKYFKDKNIGYISEASDSVQTFLNGSYYLTILNVSKSFNESYFVVEDTVTENLISSFIQLKLEELTGQCGKVVIKNQIARLGTDVVISYYPSDVAIHTGTSLGRTWLYFLKNISLPSVSFSERKVSAFLFELTIFNVSLSQEGRYGLKCNCWGDSCVTNSEHLTVVEPPGKPELGPTTDDFSATNCIYVDADTHPYCKVMSGTPPFNVTLTIGAEIYTLVASIHDNRSFEIKNDTFHFTKHNYVRNITCHVSNLLAQAAEWNTAKLCNIEKGSGPLLIVPEYTLNHTPKIQCEVKFALPAPEVEIRIDNSTVPGQETITFDNTTQSFTSKVSLQRAEADWEGSNMCCYQRSKFYNNLEPVCKTLILKFKPKPPILGPQLEDFSTTNCIYGNSGLDIYCKTQGGTKPIQVSLTIGKRQYHLIENKTESGLYEMNKSLSDPFTVLSKTDVICQVSNEVTPEPLIVSAFLCRSEEGETPTLTVPESFVGENSLTLCEVRHARPAPKLAIYVANVMVTNVIQEDTFNDSSYMFTSKVKIQKPSRHWNANRMCCIRRSKVSNDSLQVCKNVTFEYPPSDLVMVVHRTFESDETVQILNISCNAVNSYPQCDISWGSKPPHVRPISTESRIDIRNDSYFSFSKAVFTLTKDNDNVGEIFCFTRCGTLKTYLLRKHNFLFPSYPLMSFNTSSKLTIQKNESVSINCNVDERMSINTNLLWRNDASQNIVKRCFSTMKCVLTLNETLAEGMWNLYKCEANSDYNSTSKFLAVSFLAFQEAVGEGLSSNAMVVITGLASTIGCVGVVIFTLFGVLAYCKIIKDRDIYQELRYRRRTLLLGEEAGNINNDGNVVELSAYFNPGDMQRYNTLTTQDVVPNSEDVSAYPFLEVERRPFRSTRETESGYVDMRDIFETCQRANCDKSFEDMNTSASTDPDEFDPRCTRKMVAESADMGYLHTVTEKR
ncbi:uncharacterized protein LOC128235101 [Mya arenaria]|uniref:uncharacterized protein LOC128235101 n=1 Tax=Mya arenaria TaxID=6604 RepID=UPI0022E239E9|nr:uncharacterized protein LOC128235101 [Mya arenaria]